MASPPQQATQLQPGDVVAERYVVMRLLGQGGMGEVHEATDTKLDRRVALKLVVAGASLDARRRLEAEAKAVAALEHPGIVTLHDVLEHGDLLVLVLELVQGQSLRDVLDTGPLAPRTAARLITSVADALGAAHAQGFVHRDVKPDNVIVRPDGRTVLLDFGIAKGPVGVSPMAATVTAAGAVVGTPAYLAPEQIRDEPVRAETDQFALAVTAYELCTGRLPWNDASVTAIMASIVSDPPRRFREPASDDDAEIESVFARALHKRAAERFPTIQAFAAALATALKSDAPCSAPTSDDSAERRALKEMQTVTAPSAESSAAPPARSTRRRFLWLPFAALLLGAGALALRGAVRSAPTAVASARATTEASAAPLLPEELPASGARTEEDRTAYREASRSLRRGDLDGAIQQLDAAVTQNPAFVGAQLMRAYASFMRAVDLDERGRVAFRAASTQRDGLSEREAKLLDALAPSFLDPPRWRESAELLEAFVGERPSDVLVWEALGFARTKLGDYPAAERAFAREIELDPKAALAYDLEAQFAHARHDDVEANAVLETCAREVPTAIRCRVDVSLLLMTTGHCAEADNAARDVLAVDPDSPRALGVRAAATATLGAPSEVVAGFLERRRNRVPKELLRGLAIEDAYLLARRQGDLSAALGKLDSLASDTSLNAADVTRLTLVRLETLWETGQTREAADLARNYLRLEATRPLPERGNSDLTGRMLMVLREAGELGEKEHQAQRAKWLDAWRARHSATEWKNEVGFDLWLSSYAAMRMPSAQQARAAIDAANELGIDIEPRGSFNGSPTVLDANTLVGSLLLAAGRLDEAEKRLRSATQRCSVVPDESARLALGDLLAQRDAKAEACASYAQVDKDWRDVRPRSVTAEAARAAAKKLGCPRKAP